MATETFTLLITTSGAGRAARQIQGIGAAAGGVRRILGFLRSALVVIASARIVGGLTKLADGLTTIKNRLRLVTKNEAELNVVAAQLLDISNRTRTSFAENVEFFNRTARATKNLNLNFKELLVISEATALAIRISGASAQEAVGGLRQLSQALAAGAAQGEELRSIVENLPRLADAIGRSFNLSGGELIAFNKQFEGIIKSEAIARGLIDEIEILRSEFTKVKFTVEDAVQVFNNKLLVFVGNLNDATSAGKKLSDIILTLAGNLDKVFLVLAGIVGFLAIQFIASQVIGLASSIATLAKFALRLSKIFLLIAFSPLIGAFKIIQLAAKALIGTFVLLSGSLVLTAALGVILGMVGAFFLLGGEIGDVKPFISEMKTAFQNLGTVTVGVITGIVRSFGILKEAAKEAGKVTIVGAVNKAKELINKADVFLGGPGDLRTDLSAGPTPALDMLLAEIKLGILETVEAGGAVETVTKNVEGFLARLKELTVLIAGDLKLLLETPTLTGGDTGGLEDIDVTKARTSLEGLIDAVSPLIKLQREMNSVTVNLNKIEAERNKQGKEGNGLGVTRIELQTEILRQQLGLSASTRQFAEAEALLARAFRFKVIPNVQEYLALLQDLKILQAEATGGISGGIESFFLKLQREAADTSGQIQRAFEKAFQGAEDALVEFVQTGTFNFANLIDSMIEDLTRLAFRGAVADLAGLFGVGASAETGKPAGGLLNDIFGNAETGGFFANLFKTAPAAAHGASFTVGGSGGVDNNLMSINGKPQLRVSRGETVTVSPKGQPVTQPLSITLNFNGPTDVNSIERSRTQIEAGLSQSLNRAARRNR